MGKTSRTEHDIHETERHANFLCNQNQSFMRLRHSIMEKALQPLINGLPRDGEIGPNSKPLAQGPAHSSHTHVVIKLRTRGWEMLGGSLPEEAGWIWGKEIC